MRRMQSVASPGMCRLEKHSNTSCATYASTKTNKEYDCVSADDDVTIIGTVDTLVMS